MRLSTAVLAFCLALSCFVVTLFLSLRADNPYPIVCRLVADKIYLPQKDIADWKRVCLHRSQLVQPWSSRQLILKDINNILQLLQVSHLEVYDPKAAQRVWTGLNKETGIESEFVDGELVVFKVHPGSVAEKAGLKYGDVVVSLNGEHPNPWQLQSSSGKVVYRRGQSEKEIELVVTEMQRDEKIEVRKISGGTWQIKIPSFRKEFFAENPLKVYQKELSSARQIVVDLRGNQGGNFVAGLRLLSSFLCTPQEIGRLVKPRDTSKTISFIPNDLNDLKQLELLEKSQALILKTPPSSDCLKAPVKVLVDAKTASVGEMVAQALKENGHAQIWGNPSSGQLLVGVWYPLDELGRGVQISIPEALYESRKGHKIEGQGVQVDRSLYYNLDEMQSGADSWLRRATETLKN